ncbi:hypothetical protein [Pseudarthrobacter oxydans]|uniref:hypothetical protein n=1 Tax=Pseudarthrobacter oxydans TaxID=1671 RepID=UPI0034505B82
MPRKKPRRWLRRLGIAALVALGLLLVSTAVNAALERAEKSSIPAYGERVPVNGAALNVYRNVGAGSRSSFSAAWAPRLRALTLPR